MGVTLSFFASLLIGILAGLGVGSGGLYLVFLDIFTETPQKEAQGLNLAFFVFALFASVLLNSFRGTYKSRRLLAAMPLGMLFAVAGALLSNIVPPDLLKKVLGVIFLVAGFYAFYRAGKSYYKARKNNHQRKRKRLHPGRRNDNFGCHSCLFLQITDQILLMSPSAQ